MRRALTGAKGRPDDNYTHEWEHAVFGGRRVHPHKQHQLQLHGFLGRAGRPWFITHATGTDDRGRPVHWSARRHRRGRLQRHSLKECHAANQQAMRLPWLSWFRWLLFWEYFHDPASIVSWMQAFFFFWGGALFTASSIGPIIPSVANGPHTVWSAWAWTAGYCSISGTDFFFLPGVYLALVEAGNSDWAWRCHAWHKGGCLGPRPRYKWFFPFKADNIMSWASWLMLCGKLFFSTAFTLYGLDPTIPINMTVWQQRVFIWVFGTWGSICFTVFGLIQCWEQSHSTWRGLIPVSRSSWDSLDFWTPATGFYGGLGFLISSVWFLVIFDLPVSFAHEVVANMGFLIGSIAFTLNGLLLWFEMAHHETQPCQAALQ